MNTTPILPGMESLVKPFKFPATPHEYKVTLSRMPTRILQLCDTRQSRCLLAVTFPANPVYDPERENLGVFF